MLISGRTYFFNWTKIWLISNYNEKTITVKTGAIFKNHPLYLLCKFLLHEVSHKKESQWYCQETVTQKILKVVHLYFCKVLEIFIILL